LTSIQVGAEPISSSALSVVGLRVAFITPDGPSIAVDGVNFAVRSGECLALVGESGSGKTTAALAVAGLIEKPGVVLSGSSVIVAGEELVGMAERQLRRFRGARIGFVFQDPTSALNPVHRIEKQLSEAIRAHENRSRKAVAKRVRAALVEAGIPADQVERVKRSYPHELSGGLQQRCAIAMALMNQPDVLVADEPTTALDATVQLEVLDSLGHLKETGVAILFITHDLAVAERVADRICVMYAGQVVEDGRAFDVISASRHPYTQALVACAPRLDEPDRPLEPIPGDVPSSRSWAPGCRFADRCPHVLARCRTENPPVVMDDGSWARCWLLDGDEQVQSVQPLRDRRDGRAE
jgi:oligopeptide/dipeptide ABC transporter ATP-binding protein